MAEVTSSRDAPWASADAVAFHEVLELVYENRVTAARAPAARFFAEYPASPYGARLERLTGVHPRQRRSH